MMNSISKFIWNKKYRFIGNGDSKFPSDNNYEDTCNRIASSISENEIDKEYWNKKFYNMLVNFEFLPGGRIIANAGTGYDNVTMFNCYVMNDINDSISGIFDTVKNAALTQKQGGGVGYDFSTLRPEGFKIHGCGAIASGPISFMQVLDATCKTIMSAGQRRGAQMGVMSCDHPDIEEFIKAKHENKTLNMFNLSVAITDKFIIAVKNDEDWDLKFGEIVHKTIKARYLWDLIMQSTYNYSEPGFILIDRINYYNNLYYCEKINATNPCGEQPLPPYGACLLGSINLTKFVDNKFTKNAKINYQKIKEIVKIAIRMLDNVIDISHYPLKEQKTEAINKRRVGIGITGLANLFMYMGVKYGSKESVKLSEEIMKIITYSAYESSVELSKEKGSFPKFDKDKYITGNFIKSLPKNIINNIKKYGIRNSHLISIAPTGTISLLAGNISSGLEPVFSFKYKRKIRNTTEEDVNEIDIMDYAYDEYLKFLNVKNIDEKELPEHFVTTDNITPFEHLEIQSILQKYTDSSISKTINVPANYPLKDFKDIYIKAYDKGLKGCTTFRPTEFISGVLIKEDSKNEKLLTSERPIELKGTTYKIKTPLSENAIYVTINDILEKDKYRPYELFINTKNLQHLSWIVAMTRLISAVFRHQSNSSFLVEELKSIYDPNGGYFKNGSYVPSLAADIGIVIEEHLKRLGMIKDKKKNIIVENSIEQKMTICPKCGEKALINQENCKICTSCDYDKCM